MSLTLIDLLIIVLYLIGIASIGLYVSRGQKTVRKFFTADRTIPTWAVTFTLMATVVSSATFVGHPGTAFEKGMILLIPHLMLPLLLIVVAIWVVPFYRRIVKMSAYEFVGERFGMGGRIYTSFGFLLDRTFDLGVTLLTTAIALYVLTGWDPLVVILGIGVFTTLYTMIGGITAVAWTNVVQGIFICISSIIILLRILFAPEIGNPGAIISTAWEAGKYNVGNLDISFQTLFDPGTPTLWIFLIAYMVQWGRRYVTDQHLVQHYLIAKTDAAASRGAFLGACALAPIFLIFMFIGASFYGFFELLPNDPGPIKSDEVMPYFLMNYIPTGIVGLILAAILAASMSSISADLNAVATVLTNDYFNNVFKSASDKVQLLFGRFMVVFGGSCAIFIAILLIPSEGAAPVMERAITIATILSAGTFGLFALGFMTEKATRLGCYTGIVCCVLYTVWALLTVPGQLGNRILDLGFNFNMNPILIGVGGHFVLFTVGYVTSLIFGGYRPENVSNYTIYELHKRRKAGEIETIIPILKEGKSKEEKDDSTPPDKQS